MLNNSYFPAIIDIDQASKTLSSIINPTPLMLNLHISEKYQANIFLKREDLQVVRSYKIRGAFNKIQSLSKDQLERGIVCASAGNHAQGFAYSCQSLDVKGIIYMPTTTPKQKVEQVRMFGKEFVDIVLVGDTFDAANKEAEKFCKQNNKTFIHPFDDQKIIEGQATIGKEIIQDFSGKIDYLFIPIGGGGLAAGVGSYFKQISPQTIIVGVEPHGAQSMRASFNKGEVTELGSIDNFVDGAAVKKVGNLTFEICKDVLDHLVSVPEGLVCSTILELYNKNAIVVEPAGALTISALSLYSDKLKGKNVVCIVSGSNNDISRTEEIRERALLYEGYKHYFVVRFPQRSGALLTFIRDVMGPNDDITHFSYTKKTNRDQGPAVLGIELSDTRDFEALIQRMDNHKIVYEYLNNKQDLFGFLI